MHIIHMRTEIPIIPYHMIPETTLPNTALTFPNT